MNEVHEHEISLNRIMTERIKHLDSVEIIGPRDAKYRGGICSILMGDLPSHDIALLLDEAAGVMVRSGQHCVHSWFNDRGHENGSLRASAYFYNTEEDAKLLLTRSVRLLKHSVDLDDSTSQVMKSLMRTTTLKMLYC